MSSKGQPNTVALEGYNSAGQRVYQQVLSVAEFPDAKQLWDSPEFIRSQGISRLVGHLFDDRGTLEQHYERTYDAQGRYQGGTITYADGRKLNSNTSGLEPSTIPHGGMIFTVHYLRNTSNPKAPNWFAFSLVVYDEQKRVYPAEHFQIPKEQQPPAIDASGVTHYEAYEALRTMLSKLPPGKMRQ